MAADPTQGMTEEVIEKLMEIGATEKSAEEN
jgi:hypothetical protein